MNRKLALTGASLVAAFTTLAFGSTAYADSGTGSAMDKDIAHYVSGPAPGTGGLILRDINGRDLGSGIGEMQDFVFESCGPNGLIEVTQLRRGGGGGWGSLYRGYVRKAYTQIPSMFPCNG